MWSSLRKQPTAAPTPGSRTSTRQRSSASRLNYSSYVLAHARAFRATCSVMHTHARSEPRARLCTRITLYTHHERRDRALVRMTTRHAAATLRTIAHTLCGNYSCTVRIPTDKCTQIAPRNEDPAKSTGSRMAFLSRDLSAKQAMAILSSGQYHTQSGDTG